MASAPLPYRSLAVLSDDEAPTSSDEENPRASGGAAEAVRGTCQTRLAVLSLSAAGLAMAALVAIYGVAKGRHAIPAVPEIMDGSFDGVLQAAEVHPDKCGTEALVNGNAKGYRGCQNVANNGKTCQGWYSQIPHPNIYLPALYGAEGIGYHNYCRNPSDSDTIWCYTIGGNQWSGRWDYCTPLAEGETPAPTPAPTTTKTTTPEPGPTPVPTPVPTPMPTPLQKEEEIEEQEEKEEEELEEKEEKEEEELAGNGQEFNPDPEDCFQHGVIYHGQHPEGVMPFVGLRFVDSAMACHKECQMEDECKFWVFHGLCFLKRWRGPHAMRLDNTHFEDTVTGTKHCQ